MAEKFTINSDQALRDFLQRVAQDYQDKKYLRGSYIAGANRTVPQNSMDFELYTHIAQFQGIDIQEARNASKLNYGIPILRRDDEMVNTRIGRVLDHLSYEEQVNAMEFMNVTSLMTRWQQIEFIDTLIRVWQERGLPWPEYVTKSAARHREREQKKEKAA